MDFPSARTQIPQGERFSCLVTAAAKNLEQRQLRAGIGKALQRECTREWTHRAVDTVCSPTPSPPVSDSLLEGRCLSQQPGGNSKG